MLDYLFTELIHAAFHEPRHYLQFEYLRNKINLPNSDPLSKLSEIEKKKVLEELKNTATDEVLYFNNEQLDSFPFFYYSRTHELDAVSTSMNYINQIIDKLEPEVSKDLKEGLAYSRAYWDNIYNKVTPDIVAQKDLKTYKTKRTIFGLKNFPTNEDDILIKSAMREYLPISKALTEYAVLDLEGLSSKQLSIENCNIDISINNNTWFLNISIPYKNDTVEYCVSIKDNTCCLFSANATCIMEEDLKLLENVFDISKAFSKVYSEMNDFKIDTYLITPVLGIYKEKERQKLLSKLAKIEELSYEKEPNKVFVRSNFAANNKTSYLSNIVDKVRTFILLNKETLDEKIDKYDKIQAAHIPPKKIDENIL